MSSPSVADFLTGGGGGKSLKFTAVGDKFEGTILGASVEQATDINGEPKTWDNGDPVYELRIKIQTDIKEDAEDDGIRTFYAKGGKAVADAPGVGKAPAEAVKDGLKEAGLKDVPIGGGIKIQHSGTKAPTKRGHSATKCYRVKFTAAPESTVSVEDF